MSANIEFEGKILDVDPENITAKIIALGGRQGNDFTFRRYVFNVIPVREDTWIRLRTNGSKTTLTVKQIDNDAIDGTSEWEVSVSDFETTLTILEKSGLKPKGYQENRRVEFELDGAELSIDYWPKLKPYLEIEASSKAEVERIATRLGFDPATLTGENTTKLYAKEGINLDEVSDLRF